MAERSHAEMRVEQQLQCTWCGHPDFDCICEEIGCMDLEDQLDALLTDDERSAG